MGLIKGLHHVALRCVGEEEMKKAVAFYTDLLGLKVLRSWGEGEEAGCMLDTGDRIIELFADAKPGRKPGQVDHLALATDDVDACVKVVREAGYTITEEPHDLEIPSNPAFPVRIAFCVGAAGEIIEFFCEK